LRQLRHHLRATHQQRIKLVSLSPAELEMRFGFADTFACSNPLFHIFAAGALIEYLESVARRSHQMPTKRQKLEEALAVRWGRTWGHVNRGEYPVALLRCPFLRSHENR